MVMRIFILFLLSLVSFANDIHYWQLKTDHYDVVYMQCGVYSYSSSEILYHDVGKIEKMVILTRTDYVKPKDWMNKHIILLGERCD
jgi:hypothetical protein